MPSTRRSNVAKTVRRSFALPGRLIEELISVANKDLKQNLNKLVTIALQEYVDNRRRLEFDRAMKQMGEDPEILKECAVIQHDFEGTEMDGLTKHT